MIVFIIFLFVATILVIAYFLSKARNQYWAKRGVRFLKPFPVLGNYASYILLKKYGGQVAQELCNKFPGEPYFGTFYGTEPALMVTDLNLIKLILTKDFYYFSGREISKYTHKEVFTTNIFFSGGDRWRVVRQNLTPMFSSSKMKSMFHLLEKSAHTFEKFLDVDFKGTIDFDVNNLMTRFTIGSIGSCVFGVDTTTIYRDTNNPFVKLGHSIFENTNERGFKFIARAIWPSIFYTFGFKLFPEVINSFFSDYLNAVFKERGYKPSNRNDFVDLILTFNENSYLEGDSLNNMKDGSSKTARVRVDNELLIAQCITFFAAGFETSATALSYILFELAKNQEAQRRAQEEVDEFLKRHNNNLKYECVNELPYLEACIYEALRLYPALGVHTREVVEDYMLPSGLVLEAGLRVHIPVYQIHHNQEFFPEPEQFRPERFLPENKSNIKPCSFLGFGDGPRICIGLRFGKMQTLCALVTFLKKYQVCLAPGQPAQLEFDPRAIVTVPKKNIRLRATERPAWETRALANKPYIS